MPERNPKHQVVNDLREKLGSLKQRPPSDVTLHSGAADGLMKLQQGIQRASQLGDRETVLAQKPVI